MIRMTRLHLINWHNFQDDIIDFKNKVDEKYYYTKGKYKGDLYEQLVEAMKDDNHHPYRVSAPTKALCPNQVRYWFCIREILVSYPMFLLVQLCF